jgi:glycosyltransferase involved in cell wall biosynthesis
MPKVSVVIPCYNQGVFLAEAINSVQWQTYSDFEIIVVDDGSTDPETRSVIDRLDGLSLKVLRTENGGLATARNRGITASSGELVLPLDADDRIAATYIERGVEILDHTPSAGVVYSRAERFGAMTGPWGLPEFSPRRILVENMVFCSAVFRRQAWEQVGGYNPNMRHGWEDWDLWLSFVELGVGFLCIPEPLFFYRVRSSSMTSSMSYLQKFRMMSRLILNHPRLYAKVGIELLTGKG